MPPKRLREVGIETKADKKVRTKIMRGSKSQTRSQSPRGQQMRGRMLTRSEAAKK